MRGHGASERGDAAQHHWDQFAVDLHSVLGAIGASDDRPLIGAFHSLSAVTSLLHLNRFQRTQPWHSLVLFDPPLAGPKGHPVAKLHDEEMKALSDTALRRRRVYASVQEREKQFLRTDVFGVWETGAPLDMAHATLRPDRFADAWLLSCDPEREAFVFRTGTQTEVWDVLTRHADIIKIIASDPYRAGAESPAKVSLLAHQITGVAYAQIPGTGHFLQLEQPELCRRELINFVNR
jgi:pimeloyl-ACP methyl ester carboxylesterase